MTERVYRAVLALPQPLTPELAEAIEEMYRYAGESSPENSPGAKRVEQRKYK